MKTNNSKLLTKKLCKLKLKNITLLKIVNTFFFFLICYIIVHVSSIKIQATTGSENQNNDCQNMGIIKLIQINPNSLKTDQNTKTTTRIQFNQTKIDKKYAESNFSVEFISYAFNREIVSAQEKIKVIDDVIVASHSIPPNPFAFYPTYLQVANSDGRICKLGLVFSFQPTPTPTNALTSAQDPKLDCNAITNLIVDPNYIDTEAENNIKFSFFIDQDKYSWNFNNVEICLTSKMGANKQEICNNNFAISTTNVGIEVINKVETTISFSHLHSLINYAQKSGSANLLIRNRSFTCDLGVVQLLQSPTPTPTSKLISPTTAPAPLVTPLIDPEFYFVYPLKLIPDESLAKNMVVDQGYQVHCASSTLNIDGSAKKEGLKRYIELYGPIIINTTDPESVLMDSAIYPMLQTNVNNNDKKTQSFSGFFGYNDSDYFNSANINSDQNYGVTNGVFYGLTNNSQQCAVKLRNLDTIYKLCNTLENSDETRCPLNLTINAINLNTKQPMRLLELRDKLKVIFQQKIEGKPIVCSDLYENVEKVVNITGLKKYQEALAGLELMSINRNTGYRHAYIVIAPKQVPKNSSQKFWLVDAEKEDINQPLFTPIFIGIKIPDHSTNIIHSIDTQDSLRNSIEAFTTTENQKSHITQQDDARSSFFQNVKKASERRVSGKKLPILDCMGMPQCPKEPPVTGTSGEERRRIEQEWELRMTLIDMINAQEKECQEDIEIDMLTEKVEQLGTNIVSTESDIRKTKEDYPTYYQQSSGQRVIKWHMHIKDPGEVNNPFDGHKNIQVRAFLIAPIGYDLNWSSNNLQSFFDLELQTVMSEKTCYDSIDGKQVCGKIPEYYNIPGQNVGFESSVGKRFHDPAKYCPPEMPGCLNNSYNVSIEDNAQNETAIKTIGAKLGWLIKAVQQSLRGNQSLDGQKIQEMTTTEQLFLGQNSNSNGNGGDDNSSGGNGQTFQTCQEYKDYPTTIYSYEKTKEIVCQVTKEAPGHLNKKYLAQLIWGAYQIDGSPYQKRAVTLKGNETIKTTCGEFILNDCGASQISGVIVSSCAKDSCGHVRYLPQPDVSQACSFKGAMEQVVQQAAKELNWLKNTVRPEASEEELYGMVEGRRAGYNYQTILSQKWCKGGYEIPGCSGMNACECAMKKFIFNYDEQCK